MVEKEQEMNVRAIKKLRAERQDLDDGKNEAEIKRLAVIE